MNQQPSTTDNNTEFDKEEFKEMIEDEMDYNPDDEGYNGYEFDLNDEYEYEMGQN